ncbi:hypothetical protein [Flavobacterium tibetense]|uniref:Right-handed parallel beta-helix repeat-containing protein n=1 Tax=Flavobacterium tibetense TaxID=2233533 RepID=A0A365P192_9FLAO|nr:hypothetical protein [Flavobacterium tibetense]RBA28286.1 hypothetical protein DPN68_07600 [Flavobacterium tibetense]
MKTYLYIVLGFFLVLTSCREDFTFEPSNGNLGFSRDTIYLDTVFTDIGSSTYTLKVYNRSNKNISIPSIRLGKGAGSKYQLMVDGMPGKEFLNVEMLAKDSMFIFVSVNADVASSNPTDFLYTDQLLFGVGTNFQKVELVTLIQDAYFLYPERFGDGTTETLPIGDDEIYGFFLDDNDPINGNELHWNNSKPYVVYGYAAVPPNETLTVDAGARIHFHAESGLIVANNASLQVNGTIENQVIFEGDRLEPGFSETPGQWGTIWFTQGSTNNILSNLTVKNATVGMLVTGNDGTANPSLTLNNVQVYNCSNVGILARTGKITGQNVVINNCGETAFAGTFGGAYDFTHCTFANYWPRPNQTCVVLSDDPINNVPTPLESANFKNCIIYGSSNLGISLKKEGTTFNYSFENCLIKFADFSNQFQNNPLYQFTSSANYTNCLIATNSTVNRPEFKNPNQNQLQIGENSAARGTANFTFSNGTFDILNLSRTNPSDIGAYNWTTFD